MFSIFRDYDQLENVEQQLAAMLAQCQDAYRIATEAVFGESDPTAAGEELLALDQEINRAERAVRRELLVHGTVRGAELDFGLMLTYMSVAKDIERIGDKCKDIWELTGMGANFSVGDDLEELTRHREHVAELITWTLEAFTTEDAEKVHELISTINDDADHYDTHVLHFVRSDLPSRHAAPRALFYRYIKRLSRHLSNILSSVVMPVDRLDFYKRSKAIDAEDD
ncbi:MAG TPA: PhoU domain-containing protein [Acidimicrobiia bacterium]|nr:PhoU domain-containing protein [Acidimicrobiia bacterium]